MQPPHFFLWTSEGAFSVGLLWSLTTEYQHTFYFPSVVPWGTSHDSERTVYVPSRLWRCDSNSQRRSRQAEGIMILMFSYRSSVEATAEWWAVATNRSICVRSTRGWESHESKCMDGRCVPIVQGCWEQVWTNKTIDTENFQAVVDFLSATAFY